MAGNCCLAALLSLGCSQGVRQRTLTPSFRAFESRQPSHCRPFSNGRSSLQYSIVSLFRDILCTITAKYHESLAQPAEHLTFNQGVRGSNPRWFTIKAKQYRCRRPEAYGINCFRAFSARKFDDDSIDANHCFPLTGGIRTPSSQWLANPKPCGALFETATFKKGAIFLPIEYTKFGASICWS